MLMQNNVHPQSGESCEEDVWVQVTCCKSQMQGLYVALNALRNMIKAKAQNDLLVKDVYMAVNTVTDTVQKVQANFTLDCISARPPKRHQGVR